MTRPLLLAALLLTGCDHDHVATTHAEKMQCLQFGLQSTCCLRISGWDSAVMNAVPFDKDKGCDWSKEAR